MRKNVIKNRKAGIFSAIKILWKIGNLKDKIYFSFLLFCCFIRAISSIIIPLVTACIVSKLSGDRAGILGIYFPDDMSLIVVTILCFGILFGLNFLGSLIRAGIRLFGTKMKTKMNINSLKFLLEPRKNFNLGMLNGEASYIIKTASENVDTFIERGLIDIYCPIISCILVIVYIGTLNPITVAILLGAIVLFGLVMWFRIYFDGKTYKKLENINGSINNHTLNNIENLSYIGFTKSQNLEVDISQNLNKTYYKTDKIRILTYIIYWFLIYLIEFTAATLVVWLIIDKNMNNSEILSMMIIVIPYLVQIFSKLDNLGAMVGNIQRNGIAISRILMIKADKSQIILPVEQPQYKNLISVERLPEDEKIEKIGIKNVHVKIGTFEREYDAVFQKGFLNCVIGESGKGKTTFIKAILGLIEKESGVIEINEKYQLNNLFFENKRISIMLQDGNIFDRSLTENILYPDTEMDEKTRNLIKKFKLEKLFDREKERGINIRSNLSGGEKKRLNFIRCMRREAEVYIIDEPTNDLDEENVDKVIREIESLKEKAIVIVISHDKRLVEKSKNLIIL